MGSVAGNPQGTAPLMPLPEALRFDMDPCEFAERWLIRIDLAGLLILLSRIALQDPELKQLLRAVDLLKIISGFRTKELQESLGRTGRPTAPDDKSTHRSCPATGADLRLEGLMDPDNDPIARKAWLKLGALAQSIGLRWGGGSRIKPETGLPVDFNHFDMGPRTP